MTPDQFLIVTAITIGSIAAIILLYFIVLKRKGWLTNESSTELSYLCPNPECRKVFQKPLTLTDLSTSPPQGYLACPHCGGDLAKTSTATSEKPKIDHKSLPLEKPQLYTENLAVSTDNSELETPDGTKIPKMQEASKSIYSADTSKGLKAAPLQETKTIQSISKPKVSPKKYAEQKHSKIPQTCPHFFGYVRTLPKNTPIPDECLGCPKLVKCLIGVKKVKA